MIGALGLLDTELVAHHAAFGMPTREDQQGVPFPTTFVLDTDGRVVRTLVEENYRVRMGGRRLLAELLGASPAAPPDAPRGAAHEQVVSASVRLDSPTYYAYQRLGLQVELAIAPGWHVYGSSTPAGYVPLEIAVTSEPAGARIGPIEWPEAQPFRVTGLEEEFAVYDGTVRIDAPVEFTIGRGSGPARLDVRIAFQACSATECFAPSVITVSLTVPEAPTL